MGHRNKKTTDIRELYMERREDIDQQEMLVKILQKTEETNAIVKNVQKDVIELKERVAALEQRVAKVERDVAELKYDMAYIKVDMAEMKQKITVMEERISLLDKKIDKIDAKIDREAANASFHDRILFKNLETVMNTLNLKMTIGI